MLNRPSLFQKIFLCALLMLVLGTATAEPPKDNKLFALVIGNSDYQRVSKLINPENDARDLSKKLSALGFDVSLVQNVESKAAFKKQIRSYIKKLSSSKDAVGLFFYAGHGIQVNGTNYLIPVNSDIADAADLEDESISLPYLMQMATDAGNSMNMFFIDACRNNPYRSILSSATRSIRKGLADQQSPEGSIIVFAASPGKVAADGVGNNSPFTEALLNTIDQPGKHVLLMLQDVVKGVRETTKGAQLPWVQSSMYGDFYFAGSEETAIAPIAPPAAKQLGSTADTETVFWSSVSASSNTQAYTAYLDKYPKGLFSELAHIKIKDLESNVTLSSDYADTLNRSLDRCSAHIDNNQLTSGEGSNALDCYKNILTDSPGNNRALAGLSRLEGKYDLWARKAIAGNLITKAKSYIDKMKLVNPGSDMIFSLEKELGERQALIAADDNNADTNDVTNALLNKRRNKSVNGYFKN
ncbi:MAG: putative caspase-like protein [Arenicella sp.]|jgi:uncharacterized caspase-like protein